VQFTELLGLKHFSGGLFPDQQIFLCAGRNIHAVSFVYTRAAESGAVLGEIKEKTPRWQPRGYDTQSFRPLVQEE